MLCLSMFIFQKMVPRSLRKTLLGYKSGKRLGEGLYTFQRGREIIYNCMFSKKGVIRAYHQEETRLKFS